MSTVWFIMTEVRATARSSFPGPEDAAIFVECYVPERNIHAALESARESLWKEGYELRDVTRCLRFDLTDWDHERYPTGSEAQQLVERVAGSNVVEFGPFCFTPASD